MSGHPTPPAKADAAAWLAVAAGTIGALMATLDTSIVNAALPTIQGEVGASGSEEPGSQRLTLSQRSLSSH